MNYSENVRLAMQSIKSNRLRTFLTALIIAIGISALVGILTTIDAIEKKMTDAFSSMGANSFTIRNRGTGIRIGGSGERPKSYKPIRYEDALKFKERLNTPATVSISVFASSGSTVKYGQEKTNPNINIRGIDENGLAAQGLELSHGRSFNNSESLNGPNICVIGSEIAKSMFKDADPLDKVITAGSNRLRVVGVLAAKGSSMGASIDRAVYVPLFKAKLINSNANPSYTITVIVPGGDIVDNIIGESTSMFRSIRKIKIGESNNFEITKSDAVAQTLIENLKVVKIGGMAIGIITLLGASIALMNIMLVSVTERTREIGIRKAIGANPSVIRKQFLIEAIVICLLGGIMGIFLGVAIGNIISMAMSGGFIIPWLFIGGGLALCIGVGIVSGYYPAQKASKLDPVEALRYE
ncbi:ABC transporter permease [Pedobacter xixiisoli]|uniref:Putative ABC transport system permease protein n=1 Tax=Pedobacter xixiisoli TaxID=1476464 RepID=A0A286AF66_9SPHI|nr:ABC transporter permease [Pedobacter xixiisoli]SOD20553.1 putative ABC transport system permease protein [Pedobacter xixiisoli]